MTFSQQYVNFQIRPILKKPIPNKVHYINEQPGTFYTNIWVLNP